VICSITFLGTGYPVAITRVPGPGFNFHENEEERHLNDEYIPQLTNIFNKTRFFCMKRQ